VPAWSVLTACNGMNDAGWQLFSFICQATIRAHKTQKNSTATDIFNHRVTVWPAPCHYLLQQKKPYLAEHGVEPHPADGVPVATDASRRPICERPGAQAVRATY
jgi:hypothetical protein